MSDKPLVPARGVSIACTIGTTLWLTVGLLTWLMWRIIA